MKKTIILLLLFHTAIGYSITNTKLNKDQNIIEFVSAIEVLNQKSKVETFHSCKVFTPLSPYHTITCVVTAPKQVCVGQPFVIDYAINVRASTYIAFWADLMPAPEHMIMQGLRLIKYKEPTIGYFEEYAESVANKGGRGAWRFNEGIPAGMYHMSFTYVAQEPGVKSFTTVLATNPPSYIKMMDIIAVDELPCAQDDFAKTYNDESVTIPVLDNDYGHTALTIKEVSKPDHGAVVINPDNTLTYTPAQAYEGVDHFVYTIQDRAGNKAQAVVNIEVCRYLDTDK
ncbi:MAG: hypothetical protein AMXMBFR12_04960 [Candidatus Babeliales bacterium]